MFIRATCTKCKSRDVMHFKNNGGRLDQFCRCGFNLTTPQIAKQVRTRRLHASPKRTQAPRKSFNALGALLVLWAVGVALSLPFISTEITYAKEPDTEVLSTIPAIVNLLSTNPDKYETPEEVRNYVLAEAKKAGVHVAKIDFIAKHESQYNPKAVGDTHLKCPKTGKPIRSRGIFQITDCWYSSISDEQAFDVEFSTKFALDIISKSKKDCISQWSTCARWYKIKV